MKTRLKSQGVEEESGVLYRNSANVYDSVAEAYEANGLRQLAITNYKRSLELDRNNTHAAQQIRLSQN
ncbi:MAG TPA: hypothetical protein VFS77_20260 [Pyrinomonadaceae bacterium]|nr:hypothetical protein [Pyrinomonadaceae bacterium]